MNPTLTWETQNDQEAQNFGKIGATVAGFRWNRTAQDYSEHKVHPKQVMTWKDD
jgi:hypothetical protein